MANSAERIRNSGTHGRTSPVPVASGNTAPAGRAASRPALRRAAIGLVAVVIFQLLFASVYMGILHRPALHHAPVAVVGTSPLATALNSQGGGAVRLIAEPTAQAAQTAIHDGRAYAAIVAGPRGESLLIETAASPGTAAALTKGFTTAATVLKVPLHVRDLAPLPPSDPTGASPYFLVVAWVLGGYVGATVLGLLAGGMRGPSKRHAAARLALIAGYAVASGFAGALLFGPGLAVMNGFSFALAGTGALVVFAAAAATAGLQSALGLPGTLIAIIGMVIFGNPTAGQSIATTLLASPWNVIGQGLPSGAGLSVARSVIYLGGVNLTGPLTVLAVYVAAGTLLVLASTAWRQRRAAMTQEQPA